MKRSDSTIYRTGIGQDSHRFLDEKAKKPCLLGGIVFPSVPGFEADSDGDLVLHAICNAITSLTHVPILGKIAKELCHKCNIKESKRYLEEALKTLKNQKIIHLAITLEGKRPSFQPQIFAMRNMIAKFLDISVNDVGITATSGDGLTAFGRGEGVQCFCILTVKEKIIQ